MAFATDLLFCMVYSLDFVNEDPAKMTFRNQENHPVSFTTDGLIVCQLLAWDCMECKYVMAMHNRCLLILGVCSSLKIFSQR